MVISRPGKDEPIENRHEKAEYYMDKLFPFYEGDFDIHKAIKLSDLSEDEKPKARSLNYDITRLMMQYGYMDKTISSDFYHLNEKGLKAKRKGGHFKYLEYLDEMDKPKPTIGTLNKIGKNFGNALLSGQESRFENVANTLPIQPQIIPTNKIAQKGYWLLNILSNNWIVTIVGCAVATIIAAYVIWKFKIPH